MKARDVMTSAVTTVGPDTPISEVARLLGEHGISALPVVDEAGAPLGMVSEGDLIGRDEEDRRTQRDWWLTLLAEGETLHPDFLASLRPLQRRARDVMTTPLVTIAEETGVGEIARLLTAYRIKRLPVLRDGRIVGIVSRADLVRALAAEEAEPTGPKAAGGRLADAAAEIERRFFHRQREPEQTPLSEAPAQADEGPMAAEFRRLMADHESHEAEHRQEQRRAAAEEHRRKAAELIDHHVSDERWRSLMHEARRAAERGAQEFMVLGFPSQLCSDSGRAVNVGEPGWAATLRGESAEIYLRWERDLKPHGFRIAARILDFPSGMPGDIGLFLTWSR